MIKGAVIKRRCLVFWPLMTILLIAVFIADMMVGGVGVSLSDMFRTFTGGDVSEQTRTILLEIRWVKAVVAVFAGIAVSVSGLLMQTLFRNPLAGPYVLGVSSGASLGAALFVLGTPLMFSSLPSFWGMSGLALSSWAGASLILLAIAAVSRRMKDIMVVLILGMMFSSGIDAVVQILQFFSDEMSLKSFVIWTMGSLGTVTSGQLKILASVVSAGTLIALFSVKPLNMLLLGEQYAVTMGTDIRKARGVIYLSTVLLAGTVTAFCGPIGFLGLAVPHLTRFMTHEADHRVLVPATALTGAVMMLVCDMFSKMTSLPVNVMTSLLGIPVVIWVVLKNKNILK